MASDGDSFIILCVDDVRTSQETQPMGPHGVLRGYVYFLYVDDVRTSQETTYGSPRCVTGICLLFICR
jgi:hypothetical protein